MALTLNEKYEGNLHVEYGNRSDVCYLTLRDYMNKNKVDRVAATRALEGKLEGKKIVRFRHSGADITISLEYIHKIAEENPLEVEEPIAEDIPQAAEGDSNEA